MIIKNPQQLFEFLAFEDTRTYDFVAAGELARLLLDWNALKPDRGGGESYEMNKADEIVQCHSKFIGRRVLTVWDGLTKYGKVEFYVCMLSPRRGFNAENIDPSTWEIWDDETDYNDPHLGIDETPPEPDDCDFALGKRGVLVFTPDVVEAFEKWREEQAK